MSRVILRQVCHPRTERRPVRHKGRRAFHVHRRPQPLDLHRVGARDERREHVAAALAIIIGSACLLGYGLLTRDHPPVESPIVRLGDAVDLTRSPADTIRGYVLWLAVVVATGAATEVGRIHTTAETAAAPETAMQRQLG